jgi:hypothetical protein
LTLTSLLKEDAAMSPGQMPGQPSVRGETIAVALKRLDAGRDWEAQLAVVAEIVVDALVRGDAATLAEVPGPVRDALARLFDAKGNVREVRGYLVGILAVTRLGLEQLPDSFVLAIAPDTHAALVLQALAGDGTLSGGELRLRLGTSASQLSRVGRQLLAGGLVVQRRAGREASWEITPRGRAAVDILQPVARDRRSR